MARFEKEKYDIMIDLINIFNASQSKYRVIPVAYNPQSKTHLYAKYAEMLVKDRRIVAIFGTWRSIDRQAVLPIVERNNHLLFYPVQYEGGECSRNVLYFGATPNQHIGVGAEFGIKNIDRHVVLVGSDYVYSHKAVEIIKRYIDHYKAELKGEYYVPLDIGLRAQKNHYDRITREIVKNNPNGCLIINTSNNLSNIPFFDSLHKNFIKYTPRGKEHYKKRTKQNHVKLLQGHVDWCRRNR